MARATSRSALAMANRPSTMFAGSPLLSLSLGEMKAAPMASAVASFVLVWGMVFHSLA
jgi:hypothetical protein